MEGLRLLSRIIAGMHMRNITFDKEPISTSECGQKPIRRDKRKRSEQ